MTIKRLSWICALLFIATGSFAFWPKVVDYSKLWTQLSPEKAQQERINIPSLKPLVERTRNAVILVTTEIKQQTNQAQLDGIPPEFYRYFGQQPPVMPERKAVGLGSGFIIHPSGLALTNFHVIEGATSIKVQIGEDLKEFSATVVGSDRNTDVALLQIKSNKNDWPAIPLGSSHDLSVGDFVVAAGAPLGLSSSFSFGIISARGRREIAPSGRQGLYDFLQSDTAINQGNSGGPLLNMSGEAVAMNTAISAQGQGLGFSIPIDQIKQMLPALKEKGKVSRSWLGVRIQDVSEEAAKALGLSTAHGALVAEVVAGGPAEKAGIKPGDVVTEFDGKVIRSAASLQSLAGLAGAGKISSIKVMREGKSLNLSLKLEEMAQEKEEPTSKPESENSALKDLGMQVGDAPAKSGVQGAQINKLNQDSLAQRLGFELNDIIISVNDKRISSAKDLMNMLKNVKKGGMLKVLLRRGNSTIFTIFPKP